MKKAVVLSAVLTLTSSCASIVGRSNYPVTFVSSPEDATVQVRNEYGTTVYQGKTPATATLRSGEPYFDRQEYTVEFRKDGYQTQTQMVEGTLDGWYIGNILFGGLIGFLIVDPLTGSMWTMDKQIVTANLEER